MMDGVQSDGGNVSKRPKILTIVWLLIQLCVVAFVISGFMLLGKAATPYAFMGVFVSLLAIANSIAGIVILRKYRNQSAHGFLVGVSVMMSAVMLMSAVFAGTRPACENAETDPAEAAVCAFSIFLFILYLIFSVMLYKWRGDLLEDFSEMEDTEVELSGANGKLPPVNGQDSETDLKMV